MQVRDGVSIGVLECVLSNVLFSPSFAVRGTMDVWTREYAGVISKWLDENASGIIAEP